MTMNKENLIGQKESANHGWLRRFVRRMVVEANLSTNNPGTGTPPPDEILKRLRSIDTKLGRLARCQTCGMETGIGNSRMLGITNRWCPRCQKTTTQIVQ
jgi:hypothetical protein